VQAATTARLRWIAQARPNQVTPDGPWRNWLILAGRGYGKTRLGGEDTAAHVLWTPGARQAVIAPTARDLRLVCFEGDSGLLKAIPPECFRDGSPEKGYNRTLGEIWLANGSKIEGFTGEEPGRLRGPQFTRAWVDELAAYQYPQETWDMLQFGLRLGENPQAVVTTTPKPLPLIRHLVADAKTRVTTGSTYENAANLAKGFLEDIKRYEGTELGRQELHAELLDLSANAILKRPWWQRWKRAELPECYLILQCYDTAMTDNPDSDYSARTTWGVFELPDEDEPSVILLESWQDKALYPDLRENAQQAYRDWKDEGFETVVVIEAKNNGFSLCQDLRRAGIPARLFNPNLMGSKTTRAHLTSPLLKAGRIWAPAKKVPGQKHRDPSKFADHAERVIANCEMFPNLEHDDDVDTCTMAWSLLRNLGELTHPDDPDREYVPPPTNWRNYLET